MKFLNWMQNKFNGGQGNGKTDSVSSTANRSKSKHEPPKEEEFSEWPQGLLTIGTFGNPDPKQNPNPQQDDNPSPSEDDDLSDFTPEEVGHLQKELTKLLRKKPAPSRIEGENADLPLDRFLNCPSSLEVDRRVSSRVCGDSDDHKEEEDIDRTIRVIIDRCKDVCMKKNKKGIGKKSISFLLRKVFVCRGGFAPSPSLRDSLPESRMEKLLRTMLSKKVYSQNSSRASSMKKYLEDRQTLPKPKNKEAAEEEAQEKANDGCKWVKTDSEYIVLEI